MFVFNKKDFNKGFTLIELLIIVAVLGILALIVMFGFSDFREIARENAQKLNEYNEKTNEFVDESFENDEGDSSNDEDWDNSYADYFEWEEYNSIQLTDYKYDKAVDELGEEKALNPIIPNEIEGQKVFKIAGWAFSDNDLTSVEIPDSVTEIGEGTFTRNELTSVEIPDRVTEIGRSAFSSNQLTSVVIPDSVTEIGNWAFSRNQLTSVEIPDSVTEIGEGTFSRNELTSVEIPDSVTEIGATAFRDNELTEIIMPEDIELNTDSGDDLMGQETYFKDYYNEKDKQAGTYIRDNPDSNEWNLK